MENTLEENELFAHQVIKPIMMVVDTTGQTFDLEKLKGTLKGMKDQQSMVAAFPFPQTMRKSEELAEQTRIFEKIIELLELRSEQKDGTIQRAKGDAGDQILNEMGLG